MFAPDRVVVAKSSTDVRAVFVCRGAHVPELDQGSVEPLDVHQCNHLFSPGTNQPLRVLLSARTLQPGPG